ncbi:hypothetical protein ABZS53_15095 [Streptomyces sp. NPDC005499]|uniref:hypothetical protein n=1 Tax=Streptomyces sp. NPDC005499 TaxID=3154883 RepID=UPI0033A7850A
MEVYVCVSNDEWDKLIRSGPIALDDPSQFYAPIGSHLMLMDEALAAGYYFTPDGPFLAPEQPADPSDEGHDGGKGGKDGKDGKGEHGKRGKRSGRGKSHEQ